MARSTCVSIHAPGEGSDKAYIIYNSRIIVSIHAPGEGSDYTDAWVCDAIIVSIHAPGEGSDVLPPESRWIADRFNPRSR